MLSAQSQSNKRAGAAVGAHAIYTRIFQEGFNLEYEVSFQLAFFGVAGPSVDWEWCFFFKNALCVLGGLQESRRKQWKTPRKYRRREAFL